VMLPLSLSRVAHIKKVKQRELSFEFDIACLNPNDIFCGMTVIMAF